MHVANTCMSAGRLLLLAGTVLLMTSTASHAQSARKPSPTHADVRYGPHERNVLDIWLAEGEGRRPLVIYIHGGGFRNGSKESLNPRTLRELLDSGISVAALNYRLLAQAHLPAAHHDCRQAVQFLRSKAAEWNLDKSRFGAFGGSAGAQLCMYLAFHDEMSDAGSDDVVRRESTRLQCVATNGGQASMDLAWWQAHIPGYSSPHRRPEEYFGNVSEQDRAKVIAEVSALSLLSADDPPLYMRYAMAPGDPPPADPARAQGWKVHHVAFGVALLEKAKQLSVPAYLNHPGAAVDYRSEVAFFRKYLKAESPGDGERR